MSIFDLFTEVADRVRQMGAVYDAAEEGYNTAMEMCGNEGQVSIIDMMGEWAFHDAAEAALDNDQPYERLMSHCPYPEAVYIILAGATGVIIAIINEAKGEAIEEIQEENEEEYEGEYGEDDSWWGW